MLRAVAALIGLLALCVGAPLDLMAQERGAVALGELVQGLGVNARVLMIGAHPDDEDTFLITWLQRGRHVETAYLSLTRGDGGQNIIGNELGEALGVIRTEELLAARRIDGARQYFTRAFDFGFSKDTVDTYRHWQRDTILGDVVTVVRAFRPHVIVAVFSGTPRDGHGHHQVSGLLARAAFDAAGDPTMFPPTSHGAPWTPLKFYRAARFNPQGATVGMVLGMDVGEYSPLLGRSFGEIAGESRSQHKSQGFGAPQRKGPIMDFVRIEASRVTDLRAASAERSVFDGIDTSWARFRERDVIGRGPWLDSLPVFLAEARGAFDAFAPERVAPPLGRVRAALLNLAPDLLGCGPRSRPEICRDLETSVAVGLGRVERAIMLAHGLTLEVTTARDLLPLRVDRPVVATVYNRGRDTVRVTWGGVRRRSAGIAPPITVLPGAAVVDTHSTLAVRIDAPWWLTDGRRGAMFAAPASPFDERAQVSSPLEIATIAAPNISPSLVLNEPVTHRTVDQIKGDVRQLVAGAPVVLVNLDQPRQYAVANAPLDREFTVRVRATDDSARAVRVTLAVPRGLTVDSATRAVGLPNLDTPVSVTFRVRGQLAPGEHRIEAIAEYNGTTFRTGFEAIDYDHIRTQRIYRPASVSLSVVDVRVPPALKVAYVPGVGDNVAPMLTQLGIPVTVMSAGDIARANLEQYSTVVIGTRAYEAHPELMAANPALFDFVRAGGALVVQYGQYEMMQSGATPYPITINRPHDRVTLEDAPVTIDAPGARELTSPNRISAADFAGWVQERGLYMPRTFDTQYASLLSMSDPGEAPIRGGILVAPLGQGRYIYTSLAFFRQLPAGVPGAARLFVNLLSAGLPQARMTP